MIDGSKPRVLSIPGIRGTNKYLQNWYSAANVNVVFQCRHRASEYKRTIFNPVWLIKHRNEFDAFHLHWQFQHLGVLRCLMIFVLCRLMRKKLVWTVHEVIPHDRRSTVRHMAVNILLSLMASRVIVHNKYILERYRRHFGSRRKVCMIEHPDYEIVAISQSEAKNILQEKQFMYLYFGYLKRYKGIDQLINNFDDRELEAVLYIVGQFPRLPGEEYQLCVTKNGITLKSGECPEDMLDVYISAADVVVLPYVVCETSGALHRALQHGKVIVISSAIARTIECCAANVIVYERPSDLKAALKKARTMITTNNIVPDIFNIYNIDYQNVVSKIYR